MAPNPRVAAAYRAMTVLGIQEVKVKPVLKKLLKLYDKNWELIEEENYRVLADAIFEEEENEVQEKRRKSKNIDEEEMEDEEAQMHDEPVRPLKRLRLRGQESQTSHFQTSCAPSSVAPPLKSPKLEDVTMPESCSKQQPQNTAVSSQSEKNVRTEVCPVPPQDAICDKGKQPVSPQVATGGRRPQDAICDKGKQPVSPQVATRGRRPQDAICDKGKQPVSPQVPTRGRRPQDTIGDMGKQPVAPQVATGGRRFISKRVPTALPFKEPTVEPGYTQALITPKDEPVDDLPNYEVPIAVIPPESSSGRDSLRKNGGTGKLDGHDTLVSKCRDKEVIGKEIHASSNEEETNHEVATVPELCSSSVELASSPLGEVKFSLSCSPALGKLPSRDQLIKLMEDRCLRSYRITDPNFSVMKLLRDMCDCMLEFGTDSNDDSQEGSENITPSLDVLKESVANDALSVRGNKEELGIPSCTSNGSIDVQCYAALVAPRVPMSPPPLGDALPLAKKVTTNEFSQDVNRKGLEGHISPNSQSLVVVPQHHLAYDDLRSLHDVNDLTKGEERVRIPWVNEVTNDFPPSFYYISQNLVFQDANVKLSLYHIGDEDCCSTCLGNCLSSSTPCACAYKTVGGFAYTSEGLLKEEFLEECIVISRKPQQHYFYCKDCPLERSKNDDSLEPCKGHLKRKFIKECWSKCGCGKQCGNRVVQRGVTCNLQVFFTSEGKGWGLRTLEDLPKGAFVCEFVGEILTIKELHERNMQCTKNGKYTYPIILDADWESGVVTVNKALCLDAASYGNIARLINHRCSDANLIEIPIEVEAPDHHYYHLAFFTTRKVEALEELTWDYGIDFDDHDHPVKPFLCKCGSQFCRKMKRYSRTNTRSRRKS